MAGAACVLAALRYIAETKVHFNVEKSYFSTKTYNVHINYETYI